MPIPPNTIGEFFPHNLILVVKMQKSFIVQELNSWKCRFQRIIIKYWNPDD